jgi:hypothetical protein
MMEHFHGSNNPISEIRATGVPIEVPSNQRHAGSISSLPHCSAIASAIP